MWRGFSLPPITIRDGIEIALRHDSARARQVAASVAAFYADERIFQELSRLALGDINSDVKDAAARAIALVRDRDASLAALG